MNSKMTSVDYVRIFLYIVLTILFFTTWGLRKDLGINGFFPAVLHFGAFWIIFSLIRKKLRSNINEIDNGLTNGEKLAIKILLIFVGLSLLMFILAPFIF